MRATRVPTIFVVYGLMAGAAPVLLAVGGHLDRLIPLSLLQGCLQLAAGVGVGLALVAGSRLFLVKGARFLAEEFLAMTGNMGPREVLLLATLSGAAEELVFRGLLQPVVGLWIATALFGLMHVGRRSRLLPWTVMALVGGALFGILFDWTGHLLAPAAAHITVNYVNLRHFALRGGRARSR